MEYTSCIEIRDLKKKYKGFQLEVPELNIPQGFATALIGENGAGKSTLLRILAGISLDYKGDISYFGGESDEKMIRENIGYTGPGNYFMPHWSIEQIAEVSEILFDQYDASRYRKLCAELNVKTPEGVNKKDKQFCKLSDGMKMKVILANAFARDTKLLMMDEPASPLDPLMRDKLCSMIREYIDEREDHAVFFSTHNIADMENVTDYAIIIEQGKVVEQGFVEDLKDKYILVKGEKEDLPELKNVLINCQSNVYGFTGLCLAENVDMLVGRNVAKERPTLSQISVAVMKQYSKLS